MPGGSKTAQKKAANVDRYAKNHPRAAAEEAGAEDASVYSSHDDASSVEDVEPLLDGGEQMEGGDIDAPKEWHLDDGSLVFRTGKKSLRLEPRKNRRGHGEDSSEREFTPRRNRTNEAAAEEIVPVESAVPPIAAHTPIAPRAKRTRAADNVTPPKISNVAEKTSNAANSANKSEASKSPLGGLQLLLLALLLVGGVLLGGLLLSRSTTTNIAFTGSGENFTTLNQLIADHSTFKETNARLTQLESKLSDVAAQLQKHIDQKSLEQMQAMQREKEALQGEIAKLKKDMAEELAKKIDAVQLSNSIRPILEKEKLEVQHMVAKLEKRVTELESRPITTTTTSTPSTGSAGNEHSAPELAKLKKQLEELQTAISSFTTVSDKLNTLEAKLKQTILHTLESEDSKKAIVTLINAHLVHGDAKKQAELSPDALDAIVDKVLASNKDIKSTSEALTAVHKTIVDLQSDISKLKQQQQSASNSSYETDLLQRLQALESQVSQLKNAVNNVGNGNGDGNVNNSSGTSNNGGAAVAELEKTIIAIKSDLERLSASQRGDNGALVAIDRRLRDVEDKANFMPPSTTTTTVVDTTAVERRVLDTVRSEIVSEISRRVASGTVSVGRPDHALFTNGAKVMESATGWSPNVHWKGGGLFDLFGASRPPRQAPSIALDPNMTPGMCWSFPGQQGNFSVQVRCPITPTHFTVDHIPRDEAPNPKSMPRRFSVYGFQTREWNPHQPKVVKLLSGEYKDNGAMAQTFAVDRSVAPQTFDGFTLAIENNYGEEYTCLYRFRVHGDSSPSCNSASRVVITDGASANTVSAH